MIYIICSGVGHHSYFSASVLIIGLIPDIFTQDASASLASNVKQTHWEFLIAPTFQCQEKQANSPAGSCWVHLTAVLFFDHFVPIFTQICSFMALCVHCWHQCLLLLSFQQRNWNGGCRPCICSLLALQPSESCLCQNNICMKWTLSAYIFIPITIKEEQRAELGIRT